ncbi:MAG TPA: 16S rRNA (guanine(527)-N(7))-methyltransferase RsmG [Bacilli bacterium]
MDTLERHFTAWLKARNIALNDAQLAQFSLYCRELADWNEKINLTAITEREAVYVKHFYDSLSVAFFVPLNQISTLADIGSGAGFPGIPLKILFPHLQLTIVDSLRKRILFLRSLAEKLGLKNVAFVHARAEDAARERALRDHFDLVTARAVARMNVLAELCLPFVKPGGTFVAMKGASLGDELKEAHFALQQLGGELTADHEFVLPVEESARRLVVIKKTRNTPRKYPRKPGIPGKQPLL